MYHYAVLTEKFIPISFLTYSFEEDLAIGQLVEVEIRSSLEKGIIWQKVEAPVEKQSYPQAKNVVKGREEIDQVSENTKEEKDNIESDNTIVEKKYQIKSISNILPYQFSISTLNFWKSFGFNNFSNLNKVFSAGMESFNLLTKADWKILAANFDLTKTTEEYFKNNSKDDLTLKSPKINYLNTEFENIAGDVNTLLRIMYLIRNVNYKNTLIIFPEIKLLKKWHSQINLKEFSDISTHTFTSGKDKASKMAVKSFLLPETQNVKKKVYFTTRSGLFLPFTNISAIFVIDESNSMYIQDQGGLYFDTRESAYLLASQFSSDLYYQSNFPSVRFLGLSETKN